MARNMQKQIEECKKTWARRGNMSDGFTISEIEQLMNIAYAKGEDGEDCVFMAVWESLYAGWIIGYRAGQRDAKRQQENGAGKRQKWPRSNASK